MNRIDKKDWYLKIAVIVGLRSTCDRGRNAAVLVKDGRIIATGYAGSPAGTIHCDDRGHVIERRGKLYGLLGDVGESNEMTEHCVRTVHAELNALLQAAKYGPPVIGATMYCTSFPCYACAKAMVNAGIKSVVALNDYQRSDKSKALFSLVNVSWQIKN
jgi:dCMP deaminase